MLIIYIRPILTFAVFLTLCQHNFSNVYEDNCGPRLIDTHAGISSERLE
jgi:hypothetical protein